MSARIITSISVWGKIKEEATALAKSGHWRTFSAFAEEAIREKVERENRKAAK